MMTDNLKGSPFYTKMREMRESCWVCVMSVLLQRGGVNTMAAANECRSHADVAHNETVARSCERRRFVFNTNGIVWRTCECVSVCV